MYAFRNVELTEALRAIVCRNTERNQAYYAEDRMLLLHGRWKHYLFMSHRSGTVLVPEDLVYAARTAQHALWCRYAEKDDPGIRIYAVSVEKRVIGQVYGNICPLDRSNHMIDLEINMANCRDEERKVYAHMEMLHQAREKYLSIPLSRHLRQLENDFMTRSGLYHAGFRRICVNDAKLIHQDELFPVFRLNAAGYHYPLNRRDRIKADDKMIYGIPQSCSADYEHWHRMRMMCALPYRDEEIEEAICI